MSNSIEKFYLGIDISKATLDVYVLPSEVYHPFPNDQRGVKALITWASKKYP